MHFKNIIVLKANDLSVSFLVFNIKKKIKKIRGFAFSLKSIPELKFWK